MRIKLKEGKNYKAWRKWAIIFVIFFVVSTISIILTGKSILSPEVDMPFCSKIKYVPAWVVDGKVIDYGYKEDWKILPDGYSFYYSSRCSACHKQIDNFGWEYFLELKEGGFAVDCNLN